MKKVSAGWMGVVVMSMSLVGCIGAEMRVCESESSVVSG